MSFKVNTRAGMVNLFTTTGRMNCEMSLVGRKILIFSYFTNLFEKKLR